MFDQEHWIYKVIRLMTKSEVKTPLSFMFKVVPWSIVALIAVVYAPVSETLKTTIIQMVLAVVMILVALVFLFAWFRPKHLVYGESSHRAEYRIEYGNEANIRSREELDELPPSSEPTLPRLEDKQ